MSSETKLGELIAPEIMTDHYRGLVEIKQDYKAEYFQANAQMRFLASSTQIEPIIYASPKQEENAPPTPEQERENNFRVVRYRFIILADLLEKSKVDLDELYKTLAIDKERRAFLEAVTNLVSYCDPQIGAKVVENYVAKKKQSVPKGELSAAD